MSLQPGPAVPQFEAEIDHDRVAPVHGSSKIRNSVGSDAAEGLFGRGISVDPRSQEKGMARRKFLDPLADCLPLIHWLPPSRQCRQKPHHRDDSRQHEDRLLVTPLHGRQYRPAFRFCQQISTGVSGAHSFHLPRASSRYLSGSIRCLMKKESFYSSNGWSAPTEGEFTIPTLREAARKCSSH